MSEQLKPCPVCHATENIKVFEYSDGYSMPTKYVCCFRDGSPTCISGPRAHNEAQAIERWNALPRSSPEDSPFDPEAEGWEPRKTGTGGGTYYDEPRPGCLTFVTIPSTGLTALLDLCDGITLYHGKHPTTALVHMIIEHNGGD